MTANATAHAPACASLPARLFSGPLGEAIERWRSDRAPVELWLAGPGGMLLFLRGGAQRLDLRAWSGSRLLIGASIRGRAPQEALCAEQGLALEGIAPAQRAQAAFETLSDCSERCAPARRPGWLRRAFLG